MKFRSVLFFIIFLSLTEPLNLPKEPDMAKKKKKNALRCERRTCELSAMQTSHPAQALKWCTKTSNFIKQVINRNLYKNNSKIILARLNYQVQLFCYSCQKFFVPMSMYTHWFDMNIGQQFFAFHNGYHFENLHTASRHSLEQFSAASSVFRLLTCVFVTPVTIIANVINIFVLYHMLKGAAGACLYYHQFELITDVISTVVYAVGEQGFYWVIHQRAVVCGFARFTDRLQMCWTTLQLSNFYNQMFLTLLIRDRCIGLKDPLVYQIKNHKKIAWMNFILVVFGSILFYSPFIFCFNFGPLKMSLAMEYGIDMEPIDRFIVSFYSVAPVYLVVLQIGYAYRTHRLFKTFLRSATTGQWVESNDIAQRRKDEKSKKQLLIGTVGLNITMCIVNGFASVYGNEGMELFLKKVTGSSMWYDYSKQVALTVRCVALFANSTVCVIIHVITCKAYRVAFKEAVIGKLKFCR